MEGRAYISREKSEQGKSSTLSLVICSEDDDDVFDANHQSQSPDDKRKDAKNIIVGRVGGEGRRVDVERTGPNVAIYNAGGLVREPGRNLLEIVLQRMNWVWKYQASCHPVKT